MSQPSLTIVAIGLLLAINIAGLTLLWAAIKSKLPELLQKPLMDLQDRVAQSSGETRQAILKGLHGAELRLAELGQKNEQASRTISDLNTLLKLPHLRGGFGEAALERLLADFLPPTAYELQYTVVPGSPERVDAIVRYGHQVLPIDSKFPREQVLPLFESDDPEDLYEARERLADFLKSQARQIAEKYIRPEHGTTELALLFLPTETLYFEAVRNGKLFEAMSALKVYPVSPTTLSIALHSVGMAQQYYDMSRGVEETLEDVRKSRRHFELFARKFEETGRSLRRAQEAFDTAGSHLGNYQTSVHRLLGEEGSADELASGSGAVASEPVIEPYRRGTVDGAGIEPTQN